MHGAIAENSYLALEPDDDDAMVQLLGCSITYRIALGLQQGQSNSLCKHCGDS